MVLKNVGIDRTIKIGGGREARAPREPAVEKEAAPEAVAESEPQEKTAEPKGEKKRERRRNYRKRRGREAGESGEEQKEESSEIKAPQEGEASPLSQQVATTSVLTSFLTPPPMLISDTLAQFYKGNNLYKDAFYKKTEAKPEAPTSDQTEPPIPDIPLKPPEYGSYEMSEQEVEEVYNLRKKQSQSSSPVEKVIEEEEKKNNSEDFAP